MGFADYNSAFGGGSGGDSSLEAGFRVTVKDPHYDKPIGVSTMRVNPITGLPYVTAFSNLGEAVAYARTRAAAAKPVAKAKKRSGAYFIFNRTDDAVLFRVVRGWLQRPGEQSKAERQEAVMVFEPKGENGWRMRRDLTLWVTDWDEEREKTRMGRGERAMTREERFGPDYDEQ